MAINLSTAAARISANAAAVATAMAGGTATADATNLAALLTVLAARPDHLVPLLGIVPLANASGINPQ